MMTGDLPVGGTPEHTSTAAIDAAARWLVDEGDTTGRAIVPELKCRFGLTAVEACQAIKEANLIRARA